MTVKNDKQRELTKNDRDHQMGQEAAQGFFSGPDFGQEFSSERFSGQRDWSDRLESNRGAFARTSHAEVGGGFVSGTGAYGTKHSEEASQKKKKEK